MQTTHPLEKVWMSIDREVSFVALVSDVLSVMVVVVKVVSFGPIMAVVSKIVDRAVELDRPLIG